VIENLSRTRRNLVLLVLAAALAWFAWTIRSVLNPVLLGYLCAFILTPVVRWVEQRGFSRRTAVNLTFVGGFLLAGLLLVALVYQLGDVARELRESRPAALPAQVDPEEQQGSDPDPPRPSFEERVQKKANAFLERLGEWGLPVPEEEVTVDFGELRELATDFLTSSSGQTRAVGTRAVDFLTSFFRRLFALAGLFVLLPLYAYYFLFVGKDVEAFFQRHLPKGERAHITRALGEIGEIVASFFRGRLGVCLVKGVVLSAGLKIAGIEFAFLLGMLSGFLSIIPFFGPFLGFLLAFVSGMTSFGPDEFVWPALWRTGLVFLVGEALEGYVLVPKILGDSLGLHPLVVFVALLAGGAALGMLGVIVALPLTASAVVLFREFVLPALRDWADEDGTPSAGRTG